MCGFQNGKTNVNMKLGRVMERSFVEEGVRVALGFAGVFNEEVMKKAALEAGTVDTWHAMDLKGDRGSEFDVMMLSNSLRV